MARRRKCQHYGLAAFLYRDSTVTIGLDIPSAALRGLPVHAVGTANQVMQSGKRIIDDIHDNVNRINHPANAENSSSY